MVSVGIKSLGYGMYDTFDYAHSRDFVDEDVREYVFCIKIKEGIM